MPNEEQKLRLEIAHVLFLDIVGYSKLRISQQTDLIRELNQVVGGTKEFVEADSQGKLVRLPTGDGMALVFRTSPEAPAQCALEISQIVKAHPDLQLRMGIHSGPVNEVADVNQRANIAGAGINLAQRIMDCGDAGHILLSKHVAEDLEQYDHWQPCLHDLGECEVKHGVRVHVFNLYTDELGNSELPAKFKSAREAKKTSRNKLLPLTAITGALVAAFLVFWFLRKSAGPHLLSPSEKSIAVLPFENLSRDPDNAYFADGIQDEILTRLSKIADLKVISRTSTQHYKSAPENLREIASQLGVANIVEGSVQKRGDAVRVNVQLIKAVNDSHLWAETYDRKLTDMFSVESEVAKAIAEQLQAKLTGREEQVISAKPTSNPEAYDTFLRGLAYTGMAGAGSDYIGAQKYLQEAVRLDPKFALAWAHLSMVDAAGYITGALQPTVALREEARQAAQTALTLQPNLGEAVLAEGSYYYACLRDYDTAVSYFEHARQLLPNSSRIPESLAYVARRRGQWDLSETYFNEADRLDPRNVKLLTQHAFNYTALRRFPEALRKFDQVLNVLPDDVDTLVREARVAQAQGDLPRAAALIAPLRPSSNNPGNYLDVLVYQAILERRPATVISRLQEILAKPDYPDLAASVGWVRFLLGWTQEAAGDHAAAQESWRQARSELESEIKKTPGNYLLPGSLALTTAFLGDKAAALTLAEHDTAANPIEKDPLPASRPLEVLARVAAQTGEPDRAIVALQKLLSIPCTGFMAFARPLTPALLRLDPMFDPLRSDPRFQKLCEEKRP